MSHSFDTHRAPLLGDLRRALHSLGRTPSYTFSVLLTFALGVGVLGYALGVAWSDLVKPFSLPEPGQLVALAGGGAGWEHTQLSGPDYRDLERALKGRVELGMSRDRQLYLKLESEEQPIRSAQISSGFFRMLGLNLSLGREFNSEECGTAAAPLIILSHEAWIRRWGGDPAIVGKVLPISGRSMQVLGVLEPTKRLVFPFMGNSEIFTPWQYEEGEAIYRDGGAGWVVGRLTKGLELSALRSELNGLEPSLGPTRTAGSRDWRLRAFRLQDQVRAQNGPVVCMMLAVSVAMLLLTSSNISHLMLARWLQRRREMTIRAALGGQGCRLFQPLLLESALLAFGGLALAVPLWMLQLRLLDDAPWQSLALSLLVGTALLAILPWMMWRRVDLTAVLKEGGASTASRQTHRVRSFLVVLQVVLSCTLLGGTFLLLSGVCHLRGLDTGFHLPHTVVGVLECSFNPGDDFRARSLAIQQEIRARAGALPGVLAVAFSNTRPFYTQDNQAMVFELATGRGVSVSAHGVDAAYFGDFGPAILRGRAFRDGEADACVVSRSLADRLWPGEDPLGRILCMEGQQGPRSQVVGIAAEARHFKLDRPPIPTFYRSLASLGAGYLSVFVRTSGEPAGLMDPLRKALKSAHPTGRVLDVDNLETRPTQPSIVGAASLGRC